MRKLPNATKSRLPSRSQVDDASIVVEKLAAIPSNLHGNAVWIFDILLAQLLQHAAETVVPALLLLGCLAGIRGSELDKQLITYMENLVSLRTMEGRKQGKHNWQKLLLLNNAPVIVASLKC